MRSIESRLHHSGHLDGHRQPNQYFTTSRSYAGRISDDHIPFLHRGKYYSIRVVIDYLHLGVRVLHWISTPFPRVWHKLDDNEENLHRPTISNLNKLLNVFVAEYLNL